MAATAVASAVNAVNVASALSRPTRRQPSSQHWPQPPRIRQRPPSSRLRWKLRRPRLRPHLSPNWQQQQPQKPRRQRQHLPLSQRLLQSLWLSRLRR